ncbi:hypothetical protein ACIQVK_25290 [Streptomyces sp. NPDC090493]|uniref:hypothetical protein n=1 Tax=Streptomyces sp. NPDC090493 TaxID=3365964 RepID=UPI0037FD7A4F
MSDEPETQDTMIAALLREREGYVQRGLKDRVAQVDEQLKHRGYKRGRPQKPAAESKESAGTQGQGDAEQRAQPPQGRQQPGTDKA